MNEKRIQQTLLFHFLTSLDESYAIAASLETADLIKSHQSADIKDEALLSALFSIFLKKKKIREKMIYHGDPTKLHFKDFVWSLDMPVTVWMYFLKQARDLEIFSLLSHDFLKLKGLAEALGISDSKVSYHRQSALISLGSLSGNRK